MENHDHPLPGGSRGSCVNWMMPLLLLIGWTVSLPAQSPVVFEKLSQENGLSQNVINCLLQDRHGFMWIGTRDGLNKYDGYKFTVYRQDELDPHSLSHNYIKSILEDSLGNLWVGTISGGLNRFDPRTESFTRFQQQPDNDNSLSDNDISSLYMDSLGVLWVATIGGGLDRFDPATETFTHFKKKPGDPQSLSDDEVYAVVEDRFGALWIGTQNGLDKLDRKTGLFTHYLHDPNQPGSLSNNSIRSIYEDHLGALWIGTWGGGLNRFERETGTFTCFNNDPGRRQGLSDNIVYTIYEDHLGTLWAGTSGGLNRFRREDNTFEWFQHQPETSGSLSNNSVNAICEDHSGLLWVGTINQLNLLFPFEKGFSLYSYEAKDQQGLGGASVGAIHACRSGEVWIGLSDSGLDRFDRATGKFEHYKNDPPDPYSLSNNRINTVFEDRSGMLWVGTYNGLNQMDPKTRKFRRFEHSETDPYSLSNSRIWSIAEDSSGALWIGTYSGLNRFDRNSGKFIRYENIPGDPESLSGNNVRTIYRDRSGNVWFGTQKGLNRYLPASNSFISYKNRTDDHGSISDNYVNCIYQSTDGQYWIGTQKGLNRFDPQTSTFQAYRKKDGLPNEVICGILEDRHGNLWISTNQGIAKFNPADQSFKTFDISDGLQGNQFNIGAYSRLPTGEMIFGGINGINLFDPAKIGDNPYQPPVVFTAFRRYNIREVEGRPLEEKGISEKEGITLSYSENIMIVEFAALNFYKSYKNQYKYRLEGFSDQWMPLETEHKVTFTNLNPGKYTLWVQGSNNDEVWNPEPAALKIRILPPWWKTWWAYTLYIFLFFGSVYALYRFQLGRKIAEQEARRLREIDHLKSQLYTNITHEFRTPLTVITGMSGEIREWLHDRAYGKIDEAAGLIQRNSDNLLNLINQLLELAKLESGNLKLHPVQADVVSYLQFLTESFQSYGESKNIKLTFYAEIEELVMDYDPDKLLVIISNLLTNALKFTDPGGKVILHVNALNRDGASRLILKVKDTGIGINEAALDHIFDRFYQVDGSSTRQVQGTGIGLALTRELVQMMGGQISVTSRPGEGTEFLITLPAVCGKGVPTSLDAETIRLEEKTKAFLPLAPKAAPLESAPPADPDKPLLLVVEDSPDIVTYLKSWLEKHYQLVIANNGEEGIAKAIELIPDIILSDIMMPGKDGFELCATLKQHPFTSHIPIILLTAKAGLEDRLTGLEYGADVYLQKPFHKKELDIQLQKLIENRKKLQEYFLSSDKEAPAPEKVIQLEDEFLKRVRQAVKDHLDDPDFDTARLCRAMGMSRSQTYRKIMALTDRSTSHYIRSIRLNIAREMLLNPDLSIAEVAYEVGFKDPSYFSRTFAEEFGFTPSETRK